MVVPRLCHRPLVDNQCVKDTRPTDGILKFPSDLLKYVVVPPRQ